MWFPDVDETVQKLIKTCVICQAIGLEKHADPLQMSPLSPKSHKIYIDFCCPFPTGHYPEVDVTLSTSAKGTIVKLQRIFATYSIPNVEKSDNRITIY